MATRFALADGSNRWARPIDATPDDIGSSTHHAMTLRKASSAALTAVRLSKAQPEGSTPVLLRGTLY